VKLMLHDVTVPDAVRDAAVIAPTVVVPVRVAFEDSTTLPVPVDEVVPVPPLATTKVPVVTAAASTLLAANSTLRLDPLIWSAEAFTVPTVVVPERVALEDNTTLPVPVDEVVPVPPLATARVPDEMAAASTLLAANSTLRLDPLIWSAEALIVPAVVVPVRVALEDNTTLPVPVDEVVPVPPLATARVPAVAFPTSR
jgi:hypothetical protein